MLAARVRSPQHHYDKYKIKLCVTMTTETAHFDLLEVITWAMTRLKNYCCTRSNIILEKKFESVFD